MLDFIVLFLTVGIPAHIKGYHYLREAIRMVYYNPDLVSKITKELYPAVAAVFGCERTHVERSIRSAIETAWLHRDDRLWQLYFRPGPDGVIARPSNAAFISRLADALLLNQDTSVPKE